jgi:hypothetical protein
MARLVADMRKELVAYGVANVTTSTTKIECLDLLNTLGISAVENTPEAFHESGQKIDGFIKSGYGEMARLLRRLAVVAITEGESSLKLAIENVLSGMTNETAQVLRKAVNNKDTKSYFAEKSLEVTIKIKAMPKDGSYTVESWADETPVLSDKNGFKVISVSTLGNGTGEDTGEDTDGDTVEPATDGDTVEPATDGDTVEPATDGDAATVDTDGKVVADVSPAGQEESDLAKAIANSAASVDYFFKSLDFITDSDLERMIDDCTIELERRAAKMAEETA